MNQEDSMTGFYYIGSNPAHIDKLVSMFKRGYASDNMQQAIVELTCEEHFLPVVICCGSHFGLAALTRLAGVLVNHPVLSVVPLILDGEKMNAADYREYVQNKLVDDIVYLKECNEAELVRKIRFIRRIKSGSFRIKNSGEMKGPQRIKDMVYVFLKRCFDVLVASFLLLLLAPLFVLIAIAVTAETRGPVFYISERAGKGYRIFRFYKFRTMFAGADRQLVELTHLNQYRGFLKPRFFKVRNDPRITRVGRFLRNSSLDELPQLINVLTGDMSLVGNRPLPLYEAETLTTDGLADRFLAPAGITGLWQIKKRGRELVTEEERISLDIDYVNNSNFIYDLRIIANTAQALIQKAEV